MDWDAILLTNDRKKKEVMLTFKKIDGATLSGSPGSPLCVYVTSQSPTEFQLANEGQWFFYLALTEPANQEIEVSWTLEASDNITLERTEGTTTFALGEQVVTEIINFTWDQSGDVGTITLIPASGFCDDGVLTGTGGTDTAQPEIDPDPDPDDDDDGGPTDGDPIDPDPDDGTGDECGPYDCNAFVDSVLSLDNTLSWHMWPTLTEVRRAQTKGPGIEDEFGNLMPDVWYYNNARGDITTTTAAYDVPAINIGPGGYDIPEYSLSSLSNLRPCGVWGRDGTRSFTIAHDIDPYTRMPTSFINPSIGPNRNFSFSVDFDLNWYWEFGEDIASFDTDYAPTIDENEAIYFAVNYTPTAWKAMGGPSERIQVALGGPGFKFYPRGGRIRLGPRGSSDGNFIEARPAIGNDIYPISGWWRVEYSAACIVYPDEQYAGLSRANNSIQVTVHSPMGTVTHTVTETNQGKENMSAVLVRDWSMVGALGITLYQTTSRFPDKGVILCSSPTTVDLRTKNIIERLRQGGQPPDYCSRIP